MSLKSWGRLRRTRRGSGVDAPGNAKPVLACGCACVHHHDVNNAVHSRVGHGLREERVEVRHWCGAFQPHRVAVRPVGVVHVREPDNVIPR